MVRLIVLLFMFVYHTPSRAEIFDSILIRNMCNALEDNKDRSLERGCQILRSEELNDELITRLKDKCPNNLAVYDNELLLKCFEPYTERCKIYVDQFKMNTKDKKTFPIDSEDLRCIDLHLAEDSKTVESRQIILDSHKMHDLFQNTQIEQNSLQHCKVIESLGLQCKLQEYAIENTRYEIRHPDFTSSSLTTWEEETQIEIKEIEKLATTCQQGWLNDFTENVEQFTSHNKTFPNIGAGLQSNSASWNNFCREYVELSAKIPELRRQRLEREKQLRECGGDEHCVEYLKEFVVLPVCENNEERCEFDRQSEAYKKKKTQHDYLRSVIFCVYGTEEKQWCTGSIFPNYEQSLYLLDDTRASKNELIETLRPLIKHEAFQKKIGILPEQVDNCIIGGGRFTNQDYGTCDALSEQVSDVGRILALKECFRKNGQQCLVTGVQAEDYYGKSIEYPTSKRNMGRSELLSVLIDNCMNDNDCAPFLSYLPSLEYGKYFNKSGCYSTKVVYRTNNNSGQYEWEKVPEIPPPRLPPQIAESQYLKELEVALVWSYDPGAGTYASGVRDTLEHVCNAHPEPSVSKDGCNFLSQFDKRPNYLGANCPDIVDTYWSDLKSGWASSRQECLSTKAKAKMLLKKECDELRRQYPHRGCETWGSYELGTWRQQSTSKCDFYGDAIKEFSSKVDEKLGCIYKPEFYRLGSFCLDGVDPEIQGAVAACHQLSFEAVCGISAQSIAEKWMFRNMGKEGIPASYYHDYIWE